ncbi:PREDICTED: uncharacterized protein LOC104776704 [Camelina sativa]|uniref:Uncharacterized protein LOC104776704 n=1 Tax=Camelina sativa TaxID=90675 RepID=A0ABM0YCY1_CAMSA|nr:PREDICTED: uncharacterized protein LOC104776704 [Camelina sativa]
MEVPIINRIGDFDVGMNSINDPTVLSRALAVSGVGKLHQAYSFWKWGALLLLAFLASFTSLTTRIKNLVFRLINVNVSLPSSTLLYDYESDSDWSFSSDSSDDDDKDDDKDDEDNSVNGDLRVKRFGYHHDDDGTNGNIPWLRRCSGSFGDLLDVGSSGVVKLWENFDFNGERSPRNAVASFLSRCGSYSLLSPAVLLAAEKKGSDDVEVSAWDARVGFGVPALLAEWKQPGRLLGKIIRVDAGDVDKIYVGDDVGGEIVGDMRMVNGALTEMTASEVERMVRRRVRRH